MTRRSRVWLNRYEMANILKEAKASSGSDWAMVALLGTIGMRITSVCNVQIEDISTTPDGYRVLRFIGKGDKPCAKALPIPVVQAVDAAAGERTSGPLCIRRRGGDKPMTRRSAAARLELLAGGGTPRPSRTCDGCDARLIRLTQEGGPMAGRITVSAGTAPIILTGLDSTNATPAYLDLELTARVYLPVTVPAGGAKILYVADTASITPTVTDSAGDVLSAVATACRAGLPVTLGPFTTVSSDQIPAGTVQLSDLTAAVQASLGKADAAVQPSGITTISGGTP